MVTSYPARIFLLVTLSFIFANSATAGMVWETTKAPIVNGNITSVNSSPAGATGKLVSIDPNDDTPNPCAGIDCQIQVGVFHNFTTWGNRMYVAAHPTGEFYWNNAYHPALRAAKTMGEVYTFLKSKGLSTGQQVTGYNRPFYCDPELPGNAKYCLIKKRWEAYSAVCYALVYTEITHSYSYVFPGQNCIGPTPPNNECNVEAGSVTLDHGELATDAVNGHKRSENVRISCTYPANANLTVFSKDANEKIMLKNDGSLYSTVNIDGVPGPTGKKINIPQGGTTINLESTLHTAGNVEAGPFSGTAILVINNY